MSVLIGLAGRSGCGKDTIAQHLIKRHRFEAVSLAEPIRRGLHRIASDMAAGIMDAARLRQMGSAGRRAGARDQDIAQPMPILRAQHRCPRQAIRMRRGRVRL